MTIRVEQIDYRGTPAVSITWTPALGIDYKDLGNRVNAYRKALSNLGAELRGSTISREGATFIAVSSMPTEKLAGRAFSLAGPHLDHTSPAV